MLKRRRIDRIDGKEEEVTGIAHLDDDTYQVVTPPATFKAGMLVLAAGPWCRSLGAVLGLSIPVYAVRGQMWATAPMPPWIFHSIGAGGGPCLFQV